MWKLRRSFCSFISILLLCSLAAPVAAEGSTSARTRKNWLTLSGDQPLVIARGGFSGVFADSSNYAYRLAVLCGLPNMHVWCDVQLTKDGNGICFPNIKLNNATNIEYVYTNRTKKSYLVNGVTVEGRFSVDFTLSELAVVNLQQNIYSRAPYFDGTQMQILTVDEHDAFFRQQNMNMTSFIISVSKSKNVHYISSPEVDFLRSVVSRFRTGPTKPVLQFLELDKQETSTNQTYKSLLKNLTFIKTFATGILVPKTYIWQVDNYFYLLKHTSLVMDAHNSGLEVFASNFVNDASPLPYDYSYDPVAEYLSFIDNGQFSVDGVLSDFPLTASATIDCFSHMGKNDTVQANILVISSEGASGDFPGCTDKAYDKAVSDGVDILDCPVQVTNDGIPFCLGSINLKQRTNADESEFSNRATNNTDLNILDGIFAYNLTWSDIQTLRPAIYNPCSNYSLYRNPKVKHEGKLLRLSDLLSFANNAASISGVLISIGNAAYLAEKQGLAVTDLVLDTLDMAGFSNQTAKKIMLQSSDSAVLKKIKSRSDYELVYVVDEVVSNILSETISEIKTFASAVVVSKRSVLPTDAHSFLTSNTSVVQKLQAFELPVYVRSFRNEFVSQAWDYFSDPYVEINPHVGIQSLLSLKYNRRLLLCEICLLSATGNRCLGYESPPNYMSTVQPGGLIQFVTSDLMAPAEAPKPVLTEDDVVEPPLPSVMKKPPTINTSNSSTAPVLNLPSGQPTVVTSTIFTIISTICSTVLI